MHKIGSGILDNRLLAALIVIILGVAGLYFDDDLIRATTISHFFAAVFLISVLWSARILSILRSGRSLLVQVDHMDLLVLMYAALSVLAGWVNGNSPWMNSALILDWYLLAFYFLCKSVFKEGLSGRDMKMVQILIVGVAGVLGIQAVYGILQWLGLLATSNPDFPVTGSFMNSAAYALFLSSLVPFLFAVVLSRRALNLSARWVGAFLTIIILSVIVLVFVQSRSSWLGIAGGATVIMIIRYRLIRKLWSRLMMGAWKVWLYVVLLVFLLSGVTLAIYYLKPDSAEGRLLIWQLSMDIIREEPLFGHGPGSFQPVYNDYQAEYFSVSGTRTREAWLADRVFYAFNDYLQMAVERGLITLGIFLILVLRLFRRSGGIVSSTVAGSLYLAGIGSIAAILITALFAYPFSLAPILVCFFLMLALISATTDQQLIFRIELRRVARSFFLLGTLILVVVGAWYLYPRYTAYKKWRQVDQITDVSRKLQGYEELYPLLKTDGMFLLFYGEYLSYSRIIGKSDRILRESLKYINDPYLHITLGDNCAGSGRMVEAEGHYRHAVYMIPNRFEPRYHLASFYINTGQTAKARVILKEIIDYKEKVPSGKTQQIKRWAREVLNGFPESAH